jgi:predicted transcriptional regulator
VNDTAKKLSAAQPHSYASPKPADQVRELLVRAGLSQRQAARELDISDRMMCDYCSGDQAVPRVVMLALERLVDLCRSIEQ